MSDSAKTIGIIMDGNRRWAKAKRLDTLEGHEEGFRKIKEVIQWAINAKVKHLIFYAFSTENWSRSSVEVAYLMKLIEKAFRERMKEIEELGVRIRVAGERERFSPKLQVIMKDVEERSKNNTALTATLCLSYGGKRDIVQAVNRLVKEKSSEITEDQIRDHLWCADVPDADIIIRPGGERRLSNFLMWQSAYSELFFLDTLWPDFSKDEFSAILAEFKTRNRRKGV